jgi:hypothetical protein
MRSSKRTTVARKNKRRRMTIRVYKRVGHCAVDSGQLVITDPAYLHEFKCDVNDIPGLEKMIEHGKHFEYSYSGCMAATLSKKRAGQLVGGKLSKKDQKRIREGKSLISGTFYHAGVAVHTGIGDGCYPVYVEYENGVVKSVKVQFFE